MYSKWMQAIESRSNKLAVCLLLLYCLNGTWPSSRSCADAMSLIATRVCFNSLSSSFQSECVFCNKFLYPQTLLTCIGQASLPSNVSQDQAFCIVTTCMSQSWKRPIMLGRRRKKRSSSIVGPLFTASGSIGNNSLINGSFALSGSKGAFPNLLSLYRIPQNPLTVAWNYTNRSLQWRIGRDPGARSTASLMSGSSTSVAARPLATNTIRSPSPSMAPPPKVTAPAPAPAPALGPTPGPSLPGLGSSASPAKP